MNNQSAIRNIETSGVLIPNPDYKQPGQYKRTTLDDAKEKADMLLQSVGGNCYTLKLNRPIEISGRGVKHYGSNVIAVTRSTYEKLEKHYNIMCDF